MKKILCGTTALVAAGLLAGEASAASGLKLGITGFYRGAMGATIGGDSAVTRSGSNIIGFGDHGRTSGGFRQEIRINFTGETTLDNGLTIGVLVGLNGENLGGFSTATPTKQSWVDFKGKFGDVRFGEFTGAMGQNCIYDPGNVTSNFGINSPNESFSNGGRGTLNAANTTIGVAPFGSIGTCYGIDSRGTKIAYFTPSFGGFTMAVSYAPSGSTRNPGGGYFYGSDLKTKRAMDVLSVGADYSSDFGGGTSLLIGGGAEWAFGSYTGLGASRPSSERPAYYQAGFQLGLPGGFVVGASGAYVANYAQAGYAATDASPSDDAWAASVGGSYTIDAVSIGLQGLYSSWEVGGDAGHDNIWGVSLNAAYALGPGINLEAQVAYEKYDPASSVYSSPREYDAVEIDAGFAINF
jgi:predicted porin